MVAEEAERDLLRVTAEFPGIVGAVRKNRVRHTERMAERPTRRKHEAHMLRRADENRPKRYWRGKQEF
jgi:hypothetical protein